MDELPVLAALEQEFTDDHLVVMTVSVGSAEDSRAALDEADVTLLTLLDERDSTISAYHVSGTPTLYLIAADGTILMSNIGYAPGMEQYLRGEIERLLR